MAGLSITDLLSPPDESRVDLHSLRFESADKAARERAPRAKMLRKRATNLIGSRRGRTLALAELLDPAVTPEIPDTPASARYIRHQRISIISWVWKAVAEDTTGTVARLRGDQARPGQSIAWDCATSGPSGSAPSFVLT